MASNSEPPQLPAPAGPPKGALGAIFLIILVDFLGFGLIIPMLPFYVPDYEQHPMKVTLLFSIFSICQFIGAPVLGALSDRFGRRPILIISQLGSAAGYILLAIASAPYFSFHPAMRLGLVYLSRVIDGFTGGNVSTAQAYISDVTDAKTRARGMGMVGAAFGIGFSLGPALGGGLGRLNTTWPAIAAALLALVAALQTWLRLPEPTVHRPVEVKNWLHPSTFVPIFKKPIVAPLLFISTISMAAFVMMESLVPVYLAKVFNWPNKQIAAHHTGLFFFYSGLWIIVVQGALIHRLTRKSGEWALAIAGPVCVAIGMCCFSWLAWQPMLMILGLAGMINAIGRSLQQPTVSSLLSKHSGPSEQGLVFGLYHGMSSIARVVGPILAGLTYPYWRNTGLFWTACVLVLIAAGWTAAVRTKAVQAPAGEISADSVGQAARTEIE